MPGPVDLFEQLADDYDRSGVAFFRPIADLLVTALAPQPGERCLDVGCGTGAVSAALLGAVGTDGHVLGVDAAEAMVRRAWAEVPGAHFEVADAAAPAPADARFDLVASSLVLFFLPDPVAALRAWHGLLEPGGRVGVTTFGDSHDAWKDADAVLEEHLPGRDPRTAEVRKRFGSDEGVDGLLLEAGFEDVASSAHRLPVEFADLAQWYAFATSTGQRAAWAAVPEGERAAVRQRWEQAVEPARRSDGSYLVWQDVRVTTGRRRG